MGLLSRWFGRKKREPWEEHPSLYGHIRSHIGTDGGLTEEGRNLPDDGRRWAGQGFRWVAGGLDGVGGYTGDPEQAEKSAETLHALLAEACRAPSSASARRAVYDAALDDTVIDYIDPLLEATREKKSLEPTRLYDVAMWLAREGADRGPVKMGIALLGLIRLEEKEDLDVLITLARHDEFTLFGSVALSNILDDPVQILWNLAKTVDGWGRIQLVERIAHTERPEIKRWLLREGYKNSIMTAYLAHTCAVAGDLHAALAAGEVDDDLLDAAGEILDGMLEPGPAVDLTGYEEGAEVVELYLNHLNVSASKLEHFLVANALRVWLEDDDRDWAALEARGWTPEFRSLQLSKCLDLVERPQWRTLVKERVRTADADAFHAVRRAALALGMDVWEESFRRLINGEDRWWEVMQTRDRRRVARVVAHAETVLPLAEIATGPARELGLGPDFQAHGHLDFVLQDLGRFPGLGWPLIRAGLRSPVARNRNMALRALSGWKDRERWPEDAGPTLEEAIGKEPDSELAEDMRKTLAGEAVGGGPAE